MVLHNIELNGVETDVQRIGTDSMSRCVSSPNEKSVFEKCQLHIFMAFHAMQSMPSLSAHSCALCKNETVILMVTVLCYSFTVR
jgi:hypothetical protein